MSRRPAPCAELEAALHAYADRELEEAQVPALEAHLEGCAGCAAALREVEAVGAVLKGWERQQAPTAPPHLARSVLARVREEAAGATPVALPSPPRRLPAGARRARSAGTASGGAPRGRQPRGPAAWGWAAAALLLLGVGAAAWRLQQPVAPAPEPFVPRAAGLPPAPGRAPGTGPVAPPALQVEPLPRELLARVPVRQLELPGGAEGLPEGVAREAFLAGALDAQRMLAMELEFERRVGVRGVWIVDVQDGVERRLLVTPAAAEAFAPEDLVAWLRARAAETASAAPGLPTLPPGPVPARELAARLAGVAQAPPAWQLGREDSPQGVLLRVRPVAQDAGLPALEALDPLDAVRAGVLRLDVDDTAASPAQVVARLRGAALPVWLPAGQLLSTPGGDVALATSSWLVPAAGEARWLLPCVPVSEGLRREGPVRLLPLLAPPALRAALLDAAPAAGVLDLVRGWRAGRGGGALPAAWSLLDLLDEAAEVARLPDLVRVAGLLPGGFAVADGAGLALGLELPPLAGPAQAALVARLLQGHAWQALRALRPAPGATLDGLLATLGAGDEPLPGAPRPGGAGDGLPRWWGRAPGWVLEASGPAGGRRAWLALPRSGAPAGER